MALPSLILKLQALRAQVNAGNSAHDEAVVDLATSCVRMANRITALELANISTNTVNGFVLMPALMDPSGYSLLPGVRVAPLTMLSQGADPLPGAAFSIVVNELEQGEKNVP